MKSKRQRGSGFTLVEVMVASTIAGLALLGVITTLFQGTKLFAKDRAMLGVNRDIRSFTARMDTDAVTSNYFALYADFSTRFDASGNELLLADGLVGDFVVFVYTDPNPALQGASMIQRLVGYYREVTNTTLNTGPVHRFDIAVSPNVDATTTTIGALLNTKLSGSISSYPVVTQVAQGLAQNSVGATPLPKLFYNFVNRSVMVDAQISESANEVQTSTQRFGNTYNFTISPRG